MKEKLIIKNFGPIKSVDLDLAKITVLIGEQATGKSTIAKVLAICRYFSYIVDYEIDINKLDEFHSNVQFFTGLKNWGIEDYISENSEIFYKNELYTFEFKMKLSSDGVGLKMVYVCNNKTIGTKVICPSSTKINVGNNKIMGPITKIVSNSKKFTKLLEQLYNLKNEEIDENYDFEWTPNENFFRLNVKKVMDNPLFIPAERGFQSLSVNKDSLVSNAILDELAKINRIVRNYKGEVSIKPLNLAFRNENRLSKVKKLNEDNFYDLHKGASGYQAAIPIVLAIKYYSEIEKIKRTFIVEEPEINLFPKAQKKIIEFLCEAKNKFNHSFLLTTHSPYILTALENLMYAHKLGNFSDGKYGEQVSSIIEEKYWINPEDVNVYYLSEEKEIDLMQREEALINKDYIDSVSNTVNAIFDKLLEIEILIKKEIQE